MRRCLQVVHVHRSLHLLQSTTPYMAVMMSVGAMTMIWAGTIVVLTLLAIRMISLALGNLSTVGSIAFGNACAFVVLPFVVHAISKCLSKLCSSMIKYIAYYDASVTHAICSFVYRGIFGALKTACSYILPVLEHVLCPLRGIFNYCHGIAMAAAATAR